MVIYIYRFFYFNVDVDISVALKSNELDRIKYISSSLTSLDVLEKATFFKGLTMEMK